MGVSIYQPPPILPNEAAREIAVLASGALTARDDVTLLAICTAVCTRLAVPTALLSTIHGQTQHVIAAHGFRTGVFPRKYSFSGHAIAAGQDVFEVSDLEADDRFSANPWVNGDAARVGFYAGALVRDDASHVIAVMGVVDRWPRRLSLQEQDVMLDAALKASIRLTTLRGERRLLPAGAA